jgi:hypothetical protein
MSGANQAKGDSPLSDTQFVEGSANKRLGYRVRRPGQPEKSQTLNRKQRFSDWAEKGPIKQKTSTRPQRTETRRPDLEHGTWTQVSDSTKRPATKSRAV